MLNGDIDTVQIEGEIVSAISLEGDLLPIGPKGDKGDPGFSPTVTTSKSGKTTTVKFETATGNVYAYIQDGEDGQGSGDMLKEVYDANNNGIVDNAEKVNNHTVEKDVPSNADFSDTKAIWGNITGTLSNQTDLNTALGAKANSTDLSTVATSGSYNDLSNKPTNVSTFTNDANYVTSNGASTTSATNTAITLSNTTTGKFKNISLKGNTQQNGTPTPSSPIPINNVSGDNEIKVENSTNVFNMIDYASNNSAYYSYSRDNGLIMLKTDDRAFGSINLKINVEGNKTYYLKTTSNLSFAIAEYNSSDTWLKNDNLTSETRTFTTNANCSYIKFKCSSSGLTYPYTIGNIYISQNDNYEVSTYNIDLPVENLIYTSPISRIGITFAYDSITGITTFSGKPEMTYAIADLINSNIPAGTYTLSLETPKSVGVGIGIRIDGGNRVAYPIPANTKSITITTTGTITSYDVYITTLDTNTTYNDSFKLQLEKGTKVNSFTPYGTTPIELNKIGTYQDYIYKYSDKWYLHKEVGKVVLTGNNSENWSLNQYGFFQLDVQNSTSSSEKRNGYSNRFVYAYNTSTDNTFFMVDNLIRIRCNTYSNTTDFKTFLSNNNAICYFIYATPTNTEITYTPLINQLESIKNAMSKEGTTNVNQVNNDAPFIITAETFTDTYNGRYENVLNMLGVK